jgi:hypothetical protein
VEFRSAAGSRKIAVSKQGERFFALVDGGKEICEIEKDFPDKFSGEAVSFREKKIALFYSFDVRELKFRQGAFTFEIRKSSDNSWRFVSPAAGKKPSEEKINLLLSALADCEAREFIDRPDKKPEFTTRITMKEENSTNPGQFNTIEMEFAAAEGEIVPARNPALPYSFKVGKEILEKLPQKLEDISEGAQDAQATAR